MSELRATRDLRIDFVRGSALLIVFSDHVVGNPIRHYTPAGVGFSDMAEVLVFLSGYVNGISQLRGSSRSGHLGQVFNGLFRCMVIYAAIQVVHAGMLLILLGATAGGNQEIQSIAPLFLLPIDSHLDAFGLLTLSALAASVCVLPLYMLFLAPVPLLAQCLRKDLVTTLIVSGQLYLAVQLMPQTFSLPQPWATSFFFNPFAWQFLFVLGIACGIRPSECKPFIPRSRFAFILAMVVIASACVIRSSVDFTFLPGAWKHTLGPVRLLHFYCVLIVGKYLLPEENRCVNILWLYPLILCGRRPLTVYCTGGLLATFGTVLFATRGVTPSSTAVINAAGWGICMLAAYATFTFNLKRFRDICGRSTLAVVPSSRDFSKGLQNHVHS